jgi:hypothetical protein
VFPGSDLPWSLPSYTGSAAAQAFECPNAIEAASRHFNLPIHENFGSAEIADIVTSLAKIDAAYGQSSTATAKATSVPAAPEQLVARI